MRVDKKVTEMKERMTAEKAAQKGIAYGVGVGPGDPELLTLKARRVILESDVIAVSGKDPTDSLAYRIALEAVPELAEKEVFTVEMPMVKDEAVLRSSHAKAAAAIEKRLDQGKNLAYLTLGDPSVYCSFSYIRHILEADGYTAGSVSGVTSFCAAAARLGTALADWDEPLHVIPGSFITGNEVPDWPGNYVIMKSSAKAGHIRDMLSAAGYEVMAVEKCGMDGEAVYMSSDEFPDTAGYFTLIVAKQKTE